MILFSKTVAAGLKNAIPCRKVGVAVLGLEVAHAHIHLIPLNSESDINFLKPKLKFSSGEFVEIAAKISKEII